MRLDSRKTLTIVVRAYTVALTTCKHLTSGLFTEWLGGDMKHSPMKVLALIGALAAYSGVAACALHTDSGVIQRDARGLAASTPTPSKARERAPAPVSAPRVRAFTATKVVAPAPAVGESPVAHASALPTLTRALEYQICWGDYIERNGGAERLIQRHVSADARAWRAHYGSFQKAYDVVLASR